ncbi:MAG TPA: ABC-2 transporter permease [Caproicibacter sp.]|nr:ABC-2 transporter permease [Caproicibacter sp.]
MSGLLIKELLYIRKQGKTLLITLIFYGVFFLFMGGSKYSVDSMTGVVISIMVMLTVALTINTFAYDEAAKWDNFVKSLPISIRGIVGSKYLFAVILSAIGVVLSCMIELITLHGQVKLEDLAAICAGTGAAPMMLCSILLPLFYKFGPYKARFAFMILLVVPFAAVLLMKRAGFSMTGEQVLLLLKLSPVILLVIVAASYLISCGIYERKEV